VNRRTQLSDLLIDYVPKEGFELLNQYYEHLQMCWNTLVQHAECLLEHYDPLEAELQGRVPAPPASYPEPLRKSMERMTKVVEGVGWLQMGLPRENIIEAQLGYALRHLIMHLQEGRGCGHGLVGILEIHK
jgi:hypothetical protein